MYHLNRIEMIVSEYVPDEEKQVYYKFECMHDWRDKKEYDIMITRHDESIHALTCNNTTHTIGIESSIVNPRVVMDRILRFKERPHYFFWRITEVFEKSDLEKPSEGLSIMNYHDDSIVTVLW